MFGKKALFEFFKISPTPSLVLLPDAPRFTITNVNDAYLEATQSERDDLIGKGIFEAFPDNDSDPTADGVKNLSHSLHTVVRTNKKHKMAVQKYDIPIRGTSEFELKYWEPENIPLIDEGQLKFIVHCVRDITERKKTEEALKLLNHKLEEKVKERTEEVENALTENTITLESIGDAFFAVDKQWTVTYWNRIAERDLGMLKEDIVGKNLWEVFSDNTNSESYRKYHQAIDTNQVIHFEDYYQSLNTWFEISAYPSENGLSVYFKDVSERKKSEEIIEKSNERFEYVTKATFDAIWDWNLLTDKIYWGEGFELIFGYHIGALKNDSSSWRKNIHPEDLEKITESYYKIVKSNKTNWAEEYRYKKNNGQYCYVINKGIVIRDSTGRAIRIIGAMQDITKKKQEELRLKLLESVITNANDSVLITEAEPFDEPGPRIVYVNEAFTKMTGYNAEEVIGKTPRLLQGPKTDKAELKKLSNALRKWEPYEVTLLNYKKNGEEFWIHMSINPVANAAGWYTHWIAIERDVTEEKKTLLQLATSEKRYNDLFHLSPQPMWVYDIKTLRFLDVNLAAEKYYGYSLQEFLGMTIKDIRPAEDVHELTKRIDFLNENMGSHALGTFRHKKKNGEIIHVEIQSNTLPFQNSIGRIILANDVTERFTYVKAIEEQNEKLREIARIQSHMVRAPLAKMMGIIHTIKNEGLDGSDNEKLYDFLLLSAEELDFIIRDISKKTEGIKFDIENDTELT